MQIKGVAQQVREEGAALAELLGHGTRSDRVEFLRSWVRYPLRFRAQQSLDEVRSQSIGDVLQEFGSDVTALVGAVGDANDGHPWGLRQLDQAVLLALVRAVNARQVFEIGTFDGGTTALLADAVGTQGHVFTLDLPPASFDATQSAPAFTGAMVGWRIAEAPGAERITQLLGDSLTFDYSPWQHSMDVVFVDAGHDYPLGHADSTNAFRLVRPGGLIVWDDVVPHWWGLVKAVIEVAGTRQLTRIEGTNLAFVRTPSST